MALIVVFTNKSGLAPVSDYNVQVLVGDGSSERSALLYEGQVKGHTRADGWPDLLRQFLQELPRA